MSPAAKNKHARCKPLFDQHFMWCLNTLNFEICIIIHKFIHTFHSIPIHTYIPYHTIPFHSIAFQFIHTYIPYHSIPFHYIPLHYITLHTYIPYRTIPFHSIPFHYITLHYITLHYITLHYITLHTSPINTDINGGKAESKQIFGSKQSCLGCSNQDWLRRSEWRCLIKGPREWTLGNPGRCRATANLDINGTNVNGHFRILNWRYLPYIRPM